MEVIAVATTVCALCTSIATWIEQQEDKITLFRQISSTVDQIHNILHPFSNQNFTGAGEVQLSQSIRSVGDVLQRTKEHLYVWKSNRTQKILAFLKPSSAIQKLKDDQQQINHQLVILLTAIAAVGYFRDHDKKYDDLLNSQNSQSQIPNLIQTLSQQPLIHQDALDFWRDFIGAKIEFIETDQFSLRLSMWYKAGTHHQAFNHVIMRLDEYNSGGVTPYNLARVLQTRSLREFVDEYVGAEIKDPLSKPPVIISSSNGLRLPLLIWIDDKVQNISYEIGRAQEMAIHVIHLSSTAVAKAWIEENYDFLLANDKASHIRVISDNVRLETGVNSSHYLNPFAGQNILQFLRGRLLLAPVLIYTGSSIRSTGFVDEYTAAGSTSDQILCLQYISNLAAGVDDDCEWRGFDRVHSSWT